jgi:glycosyltransferase involved in cell wall biosynthesis
MSTTVHSVTIGIPTYLGARTLTRTVDSAVVVLPRLRATAMEIIICVNGEAGDTLAAAKVCRNKYPGLVRVLWKQKRGKAGAMNYIVECACGDTIFFLDDDIVLDIDCLRLCYQALYASRRTKLVFATRRNAEISNVNPYQRFIYLALTLRYRRRLFPRPDEYVRGNCMAMRSEDYPWLPETLINDDQYLHILFWGQVHKAPKAIFSAYGVSSIRDYHRRYYRIAAGRQQMYRYFQLDQVRRYEALVNRVPDPAQIRMLTASEKVQFHVWRLVDWTAKWAFRLWGKRCWDWSRNTHDHRSD